MSKISQWPYGIYGAIYYTGLNLKRAYAAQLTAILALEGECLTVGQAAASLLSHSRWHCLTLLCLVLFPFLLSLICMLLKNINVVFDHARRTRTHSLRYTLLVMKSTWQSLDHDTPGPRPCLSSFFLLLVCTHGTR